MEQAKGDAEKEQVLIGIDPGETTGVYGIAHVDGEPLDPCMVQAKTKLAVEELMIWLRGALAALDALTAGVEIVLIFEQPADTNPKAWSAIGYVLGAIDVMFDRPNVSMSCRLIPAMVAKLKLKKAKEEYPDLRPRADRHLLDAVATYLSHVKS